MKEFIPYEQALELKQLGFDEPNYFLKWYDSKGKIREGLGLGEVKAPLYQQAFRWFREKYGYNCFVTLSILDSKWYYFRENLNDRSDNSEPELTHKFDTYEEAELECLKKLIEIVKNK